MNTNQNIQYQSLLNRNVGTNMECDEIDTDEITCINLTSTGTITGNIGTFDNLGSVNLSTTGIINAETVVVEGILTATNDALSTVTRSNKIYVSNDNASNFNPILFFVSSGVDGYKSLNYHSGLKLVYNPSTHEFRLTGAGSVLHLHNTAILTADSFGSFANTLTCSNGVWLTDYPSLVLGDSSGSTNQGVLQMWCNPTTSFLIESATTGILEIYRKVSGVGTILHFLSDTTATYYVDMNLTTGHMYKINNVNIDTDDITSVGATNKYLNSLTATLPLLYNTGTNIVSISSTGNISVATIVTTGLSEFLNGNNVQGTNYSAYFGVGNSKSAQLALLDGLGYNQYTQLYCRNNVFGVQGNITSISLEKNTSVTGTLNVSSGINIPTGQTYKINSVAIPLLSALTTTPTSTITHTFVSPNLQSNINSSSITNAMLANSSITIGSTSVSLGGTITVLTGMGNITAVGNISTSAGYLQSLIGGSNIITPSSSTGSVLLGLGSLSDGVIKISSASGAIASNGTTIQQNNGNLYIDNTGTTSINIGTVITTNTVNIGSNFNLVSKTPTFNSGRFNNIALKEFSNMQHTDSIGITTWTAIGQTSTSDPLQSNITIRGSSSYVRVTVNMSLNNWGTTASNHHMSIRQSTSAMTYGTTYATESVGSVYGIHHIFSGIQYESLNVSWIDRTSHTLGTTYYYCVVARSNTAATVGENIGNGAYCEIVLEELY